MIINQKWWKNALNLIRFPESGVCKKRWITLNPIQFNSNDSTSHNRYVMATSFSSQRSHRTIVEWLLDTSIHNTEWNIYLHLMENTLETMCSQAAFVSVTMISWSRFQYFAMRMVEGLLTTRGTFDRCHKLSLRPEACLILVNCHTHKIYNSRSTSCLL